MDRFEPALLGSERAAQNVVVAGEPSRADLEACGNLGATVAATLMGALG